MGWVIFALNATNFLHFQVFYLIYDTYLFRIPFQINSQDCSNEMTRIRAALFPHRKEEVQVLCLRYLYASRQRKTLVRTNQFCVSVNSSGIYSYQQYLKRCLHIFTYINKIQKRNEMLHTSTWKQKKLTQHIPQETERGRVSVNCLVAGVWYGYVEVEKSKRQISLENSDDMQKWNHFNKFCCMFKNVSILVTPALIGKTTNCTLRLQKGRTPISA